MSWSGWQWWGWSWYTLSPRQQRLCPHPSLHFCQRPSPPFLRRAHQQLIRSHSPQIMLWILSWPLPPHLVSLIIRPPPQASTSRTNQIQLRHPAPQINPPIILPQFLPHLLPWGFQQRTPKNLQLMRPFRTPTVSKAYYAQRLRAFLIEASLSW